MVPTTHTIVVVTPPAAILDNASATTSVIDTLGFNYCTIYVLLGATDIAMAALKVQESDAAASGTALTSGADISGLDYSAALPDASADNTIRAFDIDLRGRKRYLDVVATAGDGSAGTYITIWAELSRGEEVPVTAAQRGLAAVLAV
jgi:hypothetical protein